MLVAGVDLGDGQLVDCWVRLGRYGIAIRKKYARRGFTLPLADAAVVIAREARVRAIDPMAITVEEEHV
jgi:hypothetical protein